MTTPRHVLSAMLGTGKESDSRPQAPQRGWITRRRMGYLLIPGALLSAVAVAGMVEEPRSLTVAQGREFIQNSGDRLVAIRDGPAEPAVKKRQLQALVTDTMDVPGIARFALGRFWNSTNSEQHDEVVRLFPNVLLTNLGRSFGSYQGVRFSIERSMKIDEAVYVWSKLYRLDAALQQVTWVVSAVGGAIKIADIVAEGTSLRIRQRDDCVSFLAHNSFQALIEMLRRAIDVIA